MSAVSSALQPSKKVLIVEDDCDSQVILQQLLQRPGVQVDLASNGKECLQAVERQGADQFSLILMDVRMPVMDGRSAVVALREKGCQTPIIAMTASPSPDLEEEMLGVGCNAYVNKLLGRELFLEVVNGKLEDQSPRRALELPVLPILPEQIDDPERVLRYLAKLPRLIEDFQSALESFDTAALGEALNQLGAGGLLGYKILSTQAASIRLEIEAGDERAVRVLANQLFRTVKGMQAGQPLLQKRQKQTIH